MEKYTIIQNEVTTGEQLEKGGYFVAYNMVIRNVKKVFDLTEGEFSCLIMLFSYAGADKDKCFPSQDALAEDLNVTGRTVRRYLDGLMKKGVIDIYNRQNKNNMKITNVYDLSPCLRKIRELFCSEEEPSGGNGDVKIIKKSRNHGQDRTVLSEKSENHRQDNIVLSETPETKDRTELSCPKSWTGQNCPITNNNIINNKYIYNNHNKDYIDDDKRTSGSSKHNEEYINTVINNFREQTKEYLSKRSFDAVVRKVIDKYNQGKVYSFRDYLATALVKKIEDLEFRRMKEDAKSALKESKRKRNDSESINMVTGKIREFVGEFVPTVPFYNWLEE